MTDRTWVIVNPAAGGGRAERAWPALADRLRGLGIAYTQAITCGPGDAAFLARQAVADRAGRLIVVGGDGTLNEVVNGCLDAGSAPEDVPTLALLPIGTGTDFARALGIGDEGAALSALQGGAARPIDVGLVAYRTPAGAEGSRRFVNVADFGLGPVTSRLIAAGPKALGPAAYFYGALRSIATYRPTAIRVSVDDAVAYDGPSGLVAVANSRSFGGGMAVAPGAAPDDGRFDVVLLADVPRRVLAGTLLPRVYRGTHLGHPAVRLVRGGAVEVTADAPFPLEVDGEIVGTTPARFTLHPGAVRVLAPMTR